MFENYDAFFLTDAEGAVGGLIFYSRVPPAVVVEDMVRAGEVQPGPAGLQRADPDRRPRRVLGLRAPPLSRRVALRGMSGKQNPGNAPQRRRGRGHLVVTLGITHF